MKVKHNLSYQNKTYFISNQGNNLKRFEPEILYQIEINNLFLFHVV